MFVQSINFLHLTVSDIYPVQDFQSQCHYNKVKARSHHDIAHLQGVTDVTYQVSTIPYGFRDISRMTFLRWRSLQQGQVKVMPWHCIPTAPKEYPYQI